MTSTDNQKYVKRGENLIFEYDPGWEEELAEINRGKNGAPFLYTDNLIMLAAAFRTAFRTAYRQLSGSIKRILAGHNAPAHNTLYRRMQKLDVKINNGRITVHDKSRRLTLIADSTGRKQHNRGEWIRHKWKKRRGFAKAHLMIDADTMKVLAVVITDEREGDGAQLKEMVDEVLGSDVTDCTAKSNESKTDDALKANYNKLASGIPPIGQPDVGSDPAAVLYADGAYGSRKIITMLSNRNIKANVRVNVTSTPKGKGYGDAWGLHVRRQLGGGPEETVGGLSRDERLENMRYWKSTVQYNRRWLVEIVISAIKRMFGEDLRALKWENIVQEVKLRIWLYNKWIDEAIAT